MITSVPSVKVPACSFRGAEKESETKQVTDVSGKIDEFVKEGIEATDSVAAGMEAAAAATGKLGTSALGLAAIFKSPFNKIYDFFTEIKYTDKLDDAGNKIPQMVDILDKNGKKLKDESGKVVQKVVREINIKKVKIAGCVVGAIAAAGVLLSVAKVAIDKIKNNKTEEPKTEAVKVESEEV